MTGPGGSGPDAGGRERPVRVDDLGDLLPAARTLWGYVWAGPNSLIGLVGALTTRRRPVRWRGVLLFEDASDGLARFLRWRGFSAITLGHVIVANRPLSDQLLAHELEHVAQHERWGPLYYPAYLLSSIRGYRRNPFEVAAARAAAAVQAALEQRRRGT
ncbi:MAG TPA: hypothetical protein VFC13_07585 [Actinomycetes bacterium]|nr:hypothetical protein [Actinomycetes bacterium]